MLGSQHFQGTIYIDLGTATASEAIDKKVRGIQSKIRARGPVHTTIVRQSITHAINLANRVHEEYGDGRLVHVHFVCEGVRIEVQNGMTEVESHFIKWLNEWKTRGC